MDKIEFIKAIAWMRREMPRNVVAMSICDEAERLITEAAPKKVPLTRSEIQRNYRRRKKAAKGTT